jgi:hypothetical protein
MDLWAFPLACVGFLLHVCIDTGLVRSCSEHRNSVAHHDVRHIYDVNNSELDHADAGLYG